ncbi:uncharacterized protein LOC122240507 [Panthera tigris]|uniref:uncharacterized protein LOC122240507 n=1 Tax=Panthera tigris TaxID=9694 RepID=UPI001C6F8299|nr:uncharacterized protein LOC122240507 [Panthera tigris]
MLNLCPASLGKNSLQPTSVRHDWEVPYQGGERRSREGRARRGEQRLTPSGTKSLALQRNAWYYAEAWEVQKGLGSGPEMEGGATDSRRLVQKEKSSKDWKRGNCPQFSLDFPRKEGGEEKAQKTSPCLPKERPRAPLSLQGRESITQGKPLPLWQPWVASPVLTCPGCSSCVALTLKAQAQAQWKDHTCLHCLLGKGLLPQDHQVPPPRRPKLPLPTTLLSWRAVKEGTALVTILAHRRPDVLRTPGNSRCPLNRIRFQSVVCPPAWLVSSAPSSFYETLSEPLANGGGPHGWQVLVFTTAVPRGHPAGAGGNTQGRCHRQADCYLPGFGYSTAERKGLWCQTDQSSNPRPVVDHLCDLRQSTQSSLNSSFRFSKN